jgi:CheY-like chemotaxis protein
MQEDKEKFMAAGMDEYITKPVSRAQALRLWAEAEWTGGGEEEGDEGVTHLTTTSPPTPLQDEKKATNTLQIGLKAASLWQEAESNVDSMV